MSKRAFTLMLIALLAVIGFIASGIVYAFIHPPKPQTQEDVFSSSCRTQYGVPDTKSSTWRCLWK